MRNSSVNFRRLLPCLFACFWVAACAKAQTNAPTVAPVKAQPIYEQCAPLNAGTGADDAVAKAIAALKSQDAKARAQAAGQLAAACDRRAVEPLIDVLNDADLAVRLAAIDALGKLGDPTSVDPLVGLIGDPEWRVRLALVSALASFKTFNARNMVLNGIANPSDHVIKEEADLRVRCAAILTCNQLKDPSYSRKAILFVYNFLKMPEPNLRAIAEQTMLELKNTRNGVNELVAILKNDHNPELRRWSALWLGKIGGDAARQALEFAAGNESDEGVKAVAADALKQIK